MRVIRFMSAHEAIRLLNGDQLHNDTDHSHESRTNSIGFCFVIASDSDSAEEAIYAAAQYLTGIVTMDCCFIGRLVPPLSFKKTNGYYKGGHIDELSATSYRLSDYDAWKFYTPRLPDVLNPFKIISSINWEKPVLTTASHETL
jgi:hypothetical protein